MTRIKSTEFINLKYRHHVCSLWGQVMNLHYPKTLLSIENKGSKKICHVIRWKGVITGEDNG